MVFESRRQGVIALGAFGLLYALIYVLMRLEDFALLAGSLASFLGLAGAMYLTRNLDWYGGKAEPKPTAAANRQLSTWWSAHQKPKERSMTSHFSKDARRDLAGCLARAAPLLFALFLAWSVPVIRAW